MERPRWDRIQEIYYAAVSMAPSERSAFVERECAQDPDVLREVKSLLDTDDSSGSFLQSPVFEIGLNIIANGQSSSADNVDDSSKDDLIGKPLGQRYLVEKKLGQGGMGKVYLALDLKLHNQPVVIKILTEASLQNSYLVQKFKHEVEALARLAHPKVVRVLDFGDLNGKPYIVMQYVDGLTLRSQIKPNERMDLERAALILKQIGAALDYIHGKGIFHRDLKPDNIMLQQLNGDPEFVTIVDFGLAKVKDSVVGPSAVDNIAIGTAQYMSPEQLRGENKITAASDVYSMAVVAYEMVTGLRPFIANTAAELLELQSKGVRAKPVDLRPDLPTQAQAIILRALSFEPTARYQNTAEFGDSLAHALTNETSQAVTEPPESDVVVKPNKEDRRPSWLDKRWIVSLAVLVCIVVLIAVVIRNVRDDPEPGPTPTPTPTSTAVPPTRSVVYWLTVRSGKTYQIFFQSNNLDVFETGDKFRLNVSCPEPGYVYVFNEGTPEPGGTSFTILYPTPAMNNGSASVGKNQTLQTNWNTFSGQPGTENFWIVWSTSRVSELESAKTEAFKHRDGGLTGEALDVVKKFLITKDKEVAAKTSRDKETQKTTLRFSGDVLVKLVEFKHR
jgi:serine/threonine protein kinase